MSRIVKRFNLNNNVTHTPKSINEPAARYWAWPDIFRGVAALLVCAGHLRAALMVDYSEIKNPGLIEKIFYFLTGLGHESVVIFFVLSGFLVGGPILTRRGKFDWISYSTARLTRLLTVLLPALLLTFFVDTWISILSPGVLKGDLQAVWNSGPSNESYSNSIRTLIGNIAFLQTIAVPVYGSNGPLWSLANEFWYYLLFPIIVFSVGLIGNKSALTYRCFSTAIGALIFYSLPSSILEGFIIWLMGVIAWLICQREHARLKHPIYIIVTLAGFLFSLSHSKIGSIPVIFSGFSSDILVGITFSALIIVFRQQDRQPRLTSHVGSALKKLSDISYSLYLTHFPIVLLIAINLGTDKRQLEPTLYSALFFLLSIIALTGASYFMWWIAERHTNSIRNKITHLLISNQNMPAGQP